MKYLNIRNGFATNSSSSHSVILLDENDHLTTSFGGDAFGWGNFVLADPELKGVYLAAQLYAELRNHMSDDMASSIVRGWCPEVRNYEEIYGVDHQSHWTFPRDFEPWGDKIAISKTFVKELHTYLMRPRVVILGGNDNAHDHPDSGRGTRVLENLPRESRPMHGRKDGDWWTFFDRFSGRRVTFSLEEEPTPITKFEAPLLADIKITDFCDRGCGFCYQDSTVEGRHAEPGVIDGLAYELSQMKVFEVALGGGEPTSHPQFAEILAKFRRSNIVPNFTTRNISWMTEASERAAKIRESVVKNVGAFAYSVSTASEVDDFAEALEELHMPNEWGSRRMAIHVIPELTSQREFKRILKSAHVNHLQVTLLGLKRVGRGSSVQPVEPYNWLKILLDLRKTYGCPQIAIDTALARKSQDKLKELDRDMITWFTDEGGRSMYIDAVKKVAAPSSYSHESTFIPLERYRLRDVFARLPIEN